MTARTETSPGSFSGPDLANVLFEQFLLSRGDKVLVAYSGGMDSQVLLHALSSLQDEGHIRLTAAHLDHGWHEASRDWSKSCAQWCAQFGVKYLTDRIEIQAVRGVSLESAARSVRYAWLNGLAESFRAVLTAHHMNDQAETFLKHLFEGRGMWQLGGIHPERQLVFGSDTRLIRPLLAWQREDLEEYAREHHLNWLEDPSNQSRQHYRNFLRHDVMPQVLRFWPGAIAGLSAAADSCRKAALIEQAEYREMLREMKVPDRRTPICRADPLLIDQSALFSDYVFRGLIRTWLHDSGLSSPTSKRLDALFSQVQTAKSASLASNGFVVRWYGGCLFLTRDVVMPDVQPVNWDLEPLRLEQLGLGIRIAPSHDRGLAPGSITGSIRLNWRGGGEKITLPGKANRTRLKTAFQSQHVPPWLRKSLPHLEVNGEIAWVFGLGAMEGFVSETGHEAFVPEFFPLEIES